MKKISFKFQEIKTASEFLGVLPLMQQLMVEENNPFAKKISPIKSINAWRQAKKFGYRVYVAKNDQDILGVVGLTEIRDPLSEKKSFRINNFIVDKNFRGRGIGTAMMQRTEKIAKKEKAEFMLLEVLSTNRKAMDFYKKTLGYVYACDRMLKPVQKPKN